MYTDVLSVRGHSYKSLLLRNISIKTRRPSSVSRRHPKTEDEVGGLLSLNSRDSGAIEGEDRADCHVRLGCTHSSTLPLEPAVNDGTKA